MDLSPALLFTGEIIARKAHYSLASPVSAGIYPDFPDEMARFCLLRGCKNDLKKHFA